MMQSRKITLIVLLASLAFAGIVIIQTLWLQNAIKLKEDELDIIARSAIVKTFHEEEFSHQLLSMSHDRFIRLADSEKNGLLILLKKIIDSNFQTLGIYDVYTLGLLPCNNHSVFLSSDPSANQQLLKSKIRTAINIAHGGCDEHYSIALVFPSKRKYLVSHLGIQLALYVILLLVLASVFIYTVRTLLKQKKISDIKNDFINNMTHELKTPIASIRLASRMLKRTDHISSKEQSYLQLIENESCRLENQVDKVLQAAVLDSGSFQLEKTNIDVHVIIQKVANTFKLIVENKDGYIKLNLNAESPAIYADEIHLTNVLYNLLDNAIKYCSRPPEILISTTNQDTGLNITVRDNGIGMTSKTQQYIFEKFYRVETGDVHNVKGFGLGLSYVKSIIDAHKGSIYINSKLNSGSEFNLFFPSL